MRIAPIAVSLGINSFHAECDAAGRSKAESADAASPISEYLNADDARATRMHRPAHAGSLAL